jgi:hypothetical protein
MRVSVIQTQTKRKRLDRPVRRTEKQGRRASTARSRGSIRPTRVVSATADTARGKKRLIRWPRWAILRSNGKPLGECRMKTCVVRILITINNLIHLPHSFLSRNKP